MVNEIQVIKISLSRASLKPSNYREFEKPYKSPIIVVYSYYDNMGKNLDLNIEDLAH